MVVAGATAWCPLAVSGWHRVGRSLVRELSFRDFDQAFAFLERLAGEAVDYSRRPDMCIFGFSRVRLTIANPHHAGITEAELRLARKVDAVLAAPEASAGGDRRSCVEGPPDRLVTVAADDVGQEARPAELVEAVTGPARPHLLG